MLLVVSRDEISEKRPVAAKTYLHKLEQWLWHKLKEDFPGKRHVQQDEAGVSEGALLGENLPGERNPFLGPLDSWTPVAYPEVDTSALLYSCHAYVYFVVIQYSRQTF